jgi:hypothetical protein
VAQIDNLALEKVRAKALEDTGFLARQFLGYDFWRDEETGQETRPGGLVDWGPHGEMIEFVDRTDIRFKMLMTSRGSLKTTLGISRVMREILGNPNTRGLIGMEVFDKATDTISTIKSHFDRNERIKDVFGEMKGDPWKADRFVVRGRNKLIRGATVQGFGIEKVITGDHVDWIWLDDPVSWQQVRTPDGMHKAIQMLRQLFPILDPGGWFLITCTPYDLNDLSHHVRNELNEIFTTLQLDCGMYAVRRDDGSGGYTLEGEPRFPHHSKSFLMQQLHLKGPPDFNAQYALMCQNPADQIFFREQFKEAKFDSLEMGEMSAYVLTDTATTDKDYACYSVGAVVILDWDDTAFLADLIVGRWVPSEFRDRLVDLVDRWQRLVRIHGVVMENIGLNKLYRSAIEEEARRRGVTVNFIPIPRGQAEQGKRQRIRGLTSRFASGRFKVLDTVPRLFNDLGKEKLLWDPKGHRTKDGEQQPAGELVNQFLNFRMSGATGSMIDIADALADLEQCDHSGIRYVLPSPRPHLRRRRGKDRNTPGTRLAQVFGMEDGRRLGHPNQSFWSKLRSRPQQKPWRR